MPRDVILVPHAEDGSLFHYARTGSQHDPWGRRVTWREPAEFSAKLTLTGTERGRSAAYFMWSDEEGRTWPMFLSEMAVLAQSAIIAHGIAKGRWIPCKRGQNFGLRYAGPDLRAEVHDPDVHRT